MNKENILIAIEQLKRQINTQPNDAIFKSIYLDYCSEHDNYSIKIFGLYKNENKEEIVESNFHG